MNTKQLCSPLSILLLYALFFLPIPCFAGPFVSSGGVAATPSVYEVTINKIEFKRADGSYYTYLSTPVTVDIGAASVAPGDTAGFASGSTPPPGTYTAMRVTITRSFGMTGSATNVGPAGPTTTCRTGGTGTATISVYTVSNALSGDGTAAKQIVAIPTSADSSIENAMESAGLHLISANEVRFEVPISLTISETDTHLPFEIDFDVSNKMEFLQPVAGTCYVIPLPPTITVTTPTGTLTFDSGI